MTTRREVERAVWHSELEPPARLLVLALLSKSDNDTAIVPPEFTPSLTTLEAMTGLSRSAIGEWLNAVEDAGWVKRTRPPAGSRTARTTYSLLVGSPTAVRRSRDERKPRKKAATSTPGGLPNDGDASGFGSAPSGLVRQADHSGSTPGGPEVVRQADSTSTPGGPAPLTLLPTEGESPQEHSPVAKKPRRVTDDDPDFAAFWSTYPRRTDKGHARTAWASAVKVESPAGIVAGAERFAARCARFQTEQRFIPHPSTWLRGERWADEPEATPRTNGHQPFMNPTDADAYGGTL